MCATWLSRTQSILRGARAGLVALATILPLEVTAQPGALPKDLALVADSLACDPLPDFYSRRGPTTAPFVYGVEDGEAGESAAFWCVRRTDQIYQLVLLRRSHQTLAFSWWNPPAGLSVVELSNVELGKFRALDDPDSLGPTQVISATRAIKDEYGGTYTLFLRWNDRWWFRMFD